MSGPPTWWDLVADLNERIQRETTTTTALISAVNELEDLLGEWRDAIAEGDGSGSLGSLAANPRSE